MRLIDADALKECFPDNGEGSWTYNVTVKACIDAQPAIDAVPVKRGCWMKNDNSTYTCSECQSWIPNEQHYYARYCLHCGTKMDGEKNDQEENGVFV